MRQWRRTQKPPAPLEVKAQIIREYASRHGLRIFIETGTFFGDMLAALRDDFDQLITIELDAGLAARATGRFASDSKITIIQGDSARALPAVLATLDQPALFWLDGHFSGGVTAKGDAETPIIAELQHLFAAPTGSCRSDRRRPLIRERPWLSGIGRDRNAASRPSTGMDDAS